MGRTMSGAISPIEAVWTTVAVLGLVFSAWLAGAGWRDLSAVRSAIREVPPRARIWGPRWYVALSSVVANSALCLVWVGFAVIGVIAMQFPPPPPNPAQQVSNVWAGWVLIVMEMLLAGVQAWHLYVRRKVERAPRGPTADDYLEQSTQAGRELAHAVANDLALPVTTLDEIARDERVPVDVRSAAAESLAHLDQSMARVRALHRDIKNLGGVL